MSEELKETDYQAPDQVEQWSPDRQRPSVEEKKVVAPPDPQNETLAKLLERVNSQQQQTSAAVQLLSDPNVRSYLDATKAGQKVRLVSEDQLAALVAQAKQPAAPEPPPDFDAMTPAQLAEYQTKQTQRLLNEQVQGLIDSKFNQLLNHFQPKLAAVEATQTQQQQRDLANQLSAMKQRYPDFEQMKPLMVQLNQTVGGLTLDETYHLAKLRSGVPPVRQNELETERPTEPAERKRSYVPPAKTLGKGGFGSILNAALPSS